MELLNDGFQKFAEEWKTTQEALKVKAIEIEDRRRKMNLEFLMLKRNI